MNINNELEKFRQRKAQEFFTQELPNRLKGFKAALEGTPEEIKKKLDDQEENYVLDFWDKLDKLTEQEKKTLELAGKTADVLCEGEEKPLASEIIADQQEEIENLKKKLKATERDRELFFEQKSVTVMQNDIINFVLNVNDHEYLETLQNHVRTVYNQQIKKQEA